MIGANQPSLRAAQRGRHHAVAALVSFGVPAFEAELQVRFGCVARQRQRESSQKVVFELWGWSIRRRALTVIAPLVSVLTLRLQTRRRLVRRALKIEFEG